MNAEREDAAAAPPDKKSPSISANGGGRVGWSNRPPRQHLSSSLARSPTLRNDRPRRRCRWRRGARGGRPVYRTHRPTSHRRRWSTPLRPQRQSLEPSGNAARFLLTGALYARATGGVPDGAKIAARGRDPAKEARPAGNRSRTRGCPMRVGAPGSFDRRRASCVMQPFWLCS